VWARPLSPRTWAPNWPFAAEGFSFFTADYWERELAGERTVLQWLGSFLRPGERQSLAPYVLEPPAVNAIIKANGPGSLGLIASDLGLIEADLEMAHLLGGSRSQHTSPNYLLLHRALAMGLAEPDLAGYDVVLLDCAPNFTMVTRTGIVASDHLLIPARPDYLSTLGVDYLRRKVSELVRDYNKVAAPEHAIAPETLGIVFNMIQYAANGPIRAISTYLSRTDAWQVPVFRQTIRENKKLFGPAGEHGIPAVLATAGNDTVQDELRELANEFLTRIRL
jgi:chromosome partitioning protein